MKLSRFFAATNREALRQVRLALGPDALIVSNRRVNGGVEIVAADQTAVSENIADASKPIEESSGLQNLEQEQPLLDALGTMKGELLGRIDDLLWGSQLSDAPRVLSLFQTLLGFGFSTTLLRAMLKKLPPHLTGVAALQWARSELIKHLPLAAKADELLVPNNVIALLGPTGVGKTTTVAKLAARCVKQLGAKNVALITTDTYRIGAYEQLAEYGRLMQVPVGVAKTADELASMLAAVPEGRVVIIDNVGISQRDGHVATQSAMLSKAAADIKRVLVLNAASHGETLDEVARLYRAENPGGLHACIISKVDEANRLAPALDTAIRYRLPIHYFTNGQRVPRDLSLPDAPSLVDRAFRRDSASKALYIPSPADVAALAKLGQANTEKEKQPPSENRHSVLPAVLSAVAGGVNINLAQALEGFDNNVASYLAYSLWQKTLEPSTTKPNIDLLLPQFLSDSLAQWDGNTLLAFDSQHRLRHQNQNIVVQALSLLGDDGEALLSPYYQIEQATSWLETGQTPQPKKPQTSQALLQRVHGMLDYDSKRPIVFVLDGASLTTLRLLSEQGVPWLSRFTPKTEIRVGGKRQLLSVLMRQVPPQRINITDLNLQIKTIDGIPLSDLAVWASSRPLMLDYRHESAIPVNAHHLAIYSQTDKRCLHTLYALSAAPNKKTLPWENALFLQQELRKAYAYSGAWWPRLREQRTATTEFDVVFALQLGLSLWSIQQEPNSTMLAQALEALAVKSGSSRLAACEALYKLFAGRALQN